MGLFLCPSFVWGKLFLACGVRRSTFVCAHDDAFVITRRTPPDLRDDIAFGFWLLQVEEDSGAARGVVVTCLSKHLSLSRFPKRGKAFFGSTTHFSRGLLLSRLSFFLPF